MISSTENILKRTASLGKVSWEDFLGYREHGWPWNAHWTTQHPEGSAWESVDREDLRLKSV